MLQAGGSRGIPGGSGGIRGSEGRPRRRQRHTWSAHSWALAPYCGQQRQRVRGAALGRVWGAGERGQSLQRWRRGSRETRFCRGVIGRPWGRGDGVVQGVEPEVPVHGSAISREGPPRGSERPQSWPQWAQRLVGETPQAKGTARGSGGHPRGVGIRGSRSLPEDTRGRRGSGRGSPSPGGVLGLGLQGPRPARGPGAPPGPGGGLGGGWGGGAPGREPLGKQPGRLTWMAFSSFWKRRISSGPWSMVGMCRSWKERREHAAPPRRPGSPASRAASPLTWPWYRTRCTGHTWHAVPEPKTSRTRPSSKARRSSFMVTFRSTTRNSPCGQEAAPLGGRARQRPKVGRQTPEAQRRGTEAASAPPQPPPGPHTAGPACASPRSEPGPAGFASPLPAG